MTTKKTKLKQNILSNGKTSDKIILTPVQKELIIEIGIKLDYIKTLLKISDSMNEIDFVEMSNKDRDNISSLLFKMFNEISEKFEQLEVEFNI